MLPDFKGLRQQSQDRKDLRSLKRRSVSSSSGSRSSQQSGKTRDRTFATAKKRATPPFVYVEEAHNDFLSLWPHRYDYLYAPHPDPGTKPDWKTETSHPLSDRLILQATYLYGVRPGPETAYGLLDIDKGSPYHPRRDPLAIDRICEALDPLGLVDHLSLTSSDSEGIHVYLPCAEPLPSWQLALAITTLLENAGFKVMSGWLEVFPNLKPFSADGSISLYNGHRLPLQQGSYLLNEELCPVASSQLAFVRHWQQAAARNDINLPVVEQIIRQSRRQVYRVSGKAQKFLNDLNAEIEPGWSGRGQTNYLLGRIAMRSYIFAHTLYATESLVGQALADDIVRVAITLPGYKDYCGHQHEIEAKAREWARSIEGSHYFAYATRKGKKANSEPSWNQQQRDKARARIQAAVLDLFRQDNWPSGITARCDLLKAVGLSSKTLYNHQDLWHPDFMRLALDFEPVEIPPNPPVLHAEGGNDCALGASIPPCRTSLLGAIGWNRPTDKALGRLKLGQKAADSEAGWNNSVDDGAQQEESKAKSAEPQITAPPQQTVLDIQRALMATRAAQQAEREANQKRQQLNERSRAAVEHLARLHDWVDSGDPILRAEALEQLSRIEDSS